MKSMPVEMFEHITNYLDIVSQVQLGMVCKDTQHVSLQAKKEVMRKCVSTFEKILQTAKDTCITLSKQQSRDNICKSILHNVNLSGIQTTIMNVMLMFYYQMSGNTYSHECISNTLSKVTQNVALTDKEHKIWELCKEFWLGTDFSISIIIDNTIILTVDAKKQVIVEIFKNDHTFTCEFQIDDVDGIVSFAVEHCGLRFFNNNTSILSRINRTYNVSKTPLAMDKGYHVYCHMQDVQRPFLQLVDNINKK